MSDGCMCLSVRSYPRRTVITFNTKVKSRCHATHLLDLGIAEGRFELEQNNMYQRHGESSLPTRSVERSEDDVYRSCQILQVLSSTQSPFMTTQCAHTRASITSSTYHLVPCIIYTGGLRRQRSGAQISRTLSPSPREHAYTPQSNQDLDEPHTGTR